MALDISFQGNKDTIRSFDKWNSPLYTVLYSPLVKDYLYIRDGDYYVCFGKNNSTVRIYHASNISDDARFEISDQSIILKNS